MTSSRFVVRFVHTRTGAEALDTVEIDLVARSHVEERARREAWDRLSEASRRLLPIGYRVEWHRV